MKYTSLQYFFLSLILAITLCSCSFNHFSIPKNHHPRVRVEALSSISPEVLASQDEVKNTPSQTIENKPTNPFNSTPRKLKNQSKETISEKILKVFFPKKTEILKPILQPDPKLGKGLGSQIEGDKVGGLVVGTLALAFSIAAVLMVIGMAHGNIWVYFVVGLILAVAGTIMGFIGQQLPWKGFSIVATYLGILAIVLLLVFLVLIQVVHVAF